MNQSCIGPDGSGERVARASVVLCPVPLAREAIIIQNEWSPMVHAHIDECP
jgi:hypothetical protein